MKSFGSTPCASRIIDAGASTSSHAGAWSSFYCHLSRVLVRMGEVVKMGQAIGEVGATGNAAGPHLHTELTLAGHDVDPVPLYYWPEVRGDNVLWLQGRLKAHGYDPGPLDGIAGPRTLTALGTFQLARMIDVTRALDARTFHALRAAAR